MPAFLTSLIESGRIVELVLAFMVVEIVVLGVLGRKWHLLLAAALPGALLLLALRAALTGTDPVWIALCLANSLPAHLVDLKLRPLK